MSAPQRVPVHPSNDGNSGQGPADPLGSLLAIEDSGPWPASRAKYQALLRGVAAGLRLRDERMRLQIYSWLGEELGGLLMCRDPRERRAREQALEDIALEDDTADALEWAAHRVGDRPNLLSFLRAKIIWRANDKLESLHHRHARRLQLVPDLTAIDCKLVARPHRASERRLVLEQLLAGFEMTDVERRALGLVAQSSVAEAARRTGRSRQQIYRLMERARAWCGREVGR